MSRALPKLFLAATLLTGTLSMSGMSSTAQPPSCCYTCLKSDQTCTTNCHGNSACIAICAASFDSCQKYCGGNCV
jgi:hypothetical protein